jgi:hypothetical protein
VGSNDSFRLKAGLHDGRLYGSPVQTQSAVVRGIRDRAQTVIDASEKLSFDD